MKKIPVLFLLSAVAVLCACGGNSNNTNISPETKALQKKVASEIISYGAANAYFDDDNYFVYYVNKSDISGSANDVAAAMYPMVTEVPGVKGCIVKDAQTGKELGRYKAN